MGLSGNLFNSKNGPEARAFVMKAADIFGIAGRGALVTGQVEAGAIADGDTVYFTSITGKKLSARVKVELDQDKCPGQTAAAGMNAGLHLPGIEKDEIAAGTMLTGMAQ